ncbi:MAG: hypothetical protein SVX43_06715 [Cyanobacteriota bacterium]|nr:hypothetical protein [Cyanobacteriota bacterium]
MTNEKFVFGLFPPRQTRTKMLAWDSKSDRRDRRSWVIVKITAGVSGAGFAKPQLTFHRPSLRLEF